MTMHTTSIDVGAALARSKARGPVVSHLNPVQMCTKPVRTVHSGSGSSLGNVLNQTGSSVSGFTRKYKNWTKLDFSNTNYQLSNIVIHGLEGCRRCLRGGHGHNVWEDLEEWWDDMP